MINIFIANLDWSITSEDLKTTFSSFGEVHYAHVVYEKETKRSQGFGYVEMEEAEAAIRAIEALHGVEINGRAIDVKIASPKTNRPAKKVAVPKPTGEKAKFTRGKDFSKPGAGSRTSSYSGSSSAPKKEYTSSSSKPETPSQGTGEVRRVLRPRKNKNE